MPYQTSKNTTLCSMTKPYAVTKKQDGKLMGCHATPADAQKQMAALHAAEQGQQMDDMIRRQAGR